MLRGHRSAESGVAKSLCRAVQTLDRRCLSLIIAELDLPLTAVRSIDRSEEPGVPNPQLFKILELSEDQVGYRKGGFLGLLLPPPAIPL